MTREQILEAVHKSVRSQDSRLLGCGIDDITRFAEHIAKLAVEQEREQCAVECDYYSGQSSNPMNFAENCAKAIRARSGECT